MIARLFRRQSVAPEPEPAVNATAEANIAAYESLPSWMLR